MTVVIHDLGKYYQNKPVFCHVNIRLEEGGVYALMAPSGAGKTTLLRILMGLETNEEGSIEGLEGQRIAAVFQEDRLCPSLNAIENIRLVDPVCSKKVLIEELKKLLPADSLKIPVSAFSGGMRRRVSLLRALLSPGELLFFDEPFNGLDKQSRQTAVEYVQEKRRGRTLLFTTHYPEEARALGANCFVWEDRERTWYAS